MDARGAVGQMVIDVAAHHRMAAIDERVTMLAERLRSGLAAVGGVTVHERSPHRLALTVPEVSVRRRVAP